MNTKAAFFSPVLVVDALGFTEQIKSAGDRGLEELAARLEQQFHKFNMTVPRRATFAILSNVFGTREFSTLRLNDMFV